VDGVFLTRRREPKLVRCAVLFLDLLGVRDMSRASPREAQKTLIALERSVSGMYRDYLDPDSPLPAAFFSDALVLASPIGADGDEVSAVAELVSHAAWLQLNLLAADFFVRGGLSVGLFHIRDGLLFGPALVEAYELESRDAVNPRVVLSKAAEQAVTRPNNLLLCDGDGWTFINYLHLLFDQLDDPAIVLGTHRDHVVDRLHRHRSDKRVWEKYRWVAEYHNAFVGGDALQAMDLCVPTDAMTWRFEPFA
jgi:hypothetical protein